MSSGSGPSGVTRVWSTSTPSSGDPDDHARRLHMINPFPTDRRGLEVLSRSECERLLGLAEIGRVALISAGEPLILPVNYRFDEGTVVFRTATGEKLDAWYPATRTGWSVLVRGNAEEVYNEKEIAALEGLGLVGWVPEVQPTVWVRIRPQDITGRRI